MTIQQIVEGFTVTHAQVLDGTTNALTVTTGDSSWGDFYGIEDASLSPTFESYENKGDDTVLSRWNSVDFVEIAIKQGYFSFPFMAGLTGIATFSSTIGSAVMFRQPLWHEDALNVADRPVLLRMRSKDTESNIRRLDVVLYKVQFKPISFTGPKYRDGLKIDWTGSALQSTTDELGVTFSDGKKRIADIISAATA